MGNVLKTIMVRKQEKSLHPSPAPKGGKKSLLNASPIPNFGLTSYSFFAIPFELFLDLFGYINKVDPYVGIKS